MQCAGHTHGQPKGNNLAKRVLAQERAVALRDALAEEGAPNAMACVGFGSALARGGCVRLHGLLPGEAESEDATLRILGGRAAGARQSARPRVHAVYLKASTCDVRGGSLGRPCAHLCVCVTAAHMFKHGESSARTARQTRGHRMGVCSLLSSALGLRGCPAAWRRARTPRA